MNRSLTNRLNALEQKFSAVEPNGIILGIRTCVEMMRADPVDGRFSPALEFSRRQAIASLNRSANPSPVSDFLLLELECLPGRLAKRATPEKLEPEGLAV